MMPFQKAWKRFGRAIDRTAFHLPTRTSLLPCLEVEGKCHLVISFNLIPLNLKTSLSSASATSELSDLGHFYSEGNENSRLPGLS